jgi:hypothetical protein
MIKFKSLAEQAQLKQSDPVLRSTDHAAQADPTDTIRDHAALAAEVIRCGKIARGLLPPDPKPIDARAQFILDSAAKARGERQDD